MLDTNEIYNMDCRDGFKLMPDESVDLILTDPPYDVSYNKKSTVLSKTGRARDKQIQRDSSYQEFNFNYTKMAEEFYRLLKDNSHCYIFCGDKQLTLWFNTLLKAGFKFNNILVWVKNKQTLDLTFGLKYNYQSEFCIFIRKGVKKLKVIGKSNILFFDTGVSLKHPCEKPTALIRFLIKQSSNKGDIVLDPFMGGGSTSLACKQTNRNFIGFETSENYVDICYDKLKQEILLNTMGCFKKW